MFALFNMVVLWSGWIEPGWQGIAVAVAILLLRHPLPVLLLHRAIPDLQRWPEALFVGWFGPIGISTVFYAMLTLEQTGRDKVWTIGNLVIFASLLAHGLKATPLTRWFD